MKMPTLTAEHALGPATQTYAAASGTTAVTGALAPMGLLDDIGNAFSGILAKIPCLLGCGVPNVLSIAPRCGLDPACWLESAGPAALSCVQQCL